DMTFEQVHTSFYQALAKIEALSKKPEIIKKIKQLRETKEYIADTLSNTSGGQETDAALPAPSKKRKANDATSKCKFRRKSSLLTRNTTKLPCELHNYLVFREFEEFEELGGYHE
ncbi:11519_t:CDS:2, partial [Gigaspora rosea]